MPQSPDIGKNSDGGICVFRISGQSLIKENYQNFRTSDDIGMKLGTVTKWWRHVGKFWHHYHFLDLWPIWSNPEARFLEHSLTKFTFSLTVTIYLTKTENGIKKSLTQLSHYCFEYCFCKKRWLFAKKYWHQQN